MAVFASTRFGAPPLSSLWTPFVAWTEGDLFRQISGYGILALVAFELLIAARKRKQLRLGGAQRNWRALHMSVGAVLVPLLLLHTGGHMGNNLNAWLLFSIMGVVLVAVTGKLIEVLHIKRRQLATSNGTKLDSTGSVTGFLVKNWVHLHCLAVAVVLALLGFHILAVYYF